jgi:hypothetical protein
MIEMKRFNKAKILFNKRAMNSLSKTNKSKI